MLQGHEHDQEADEHDQIVLPDPCKNFNFQHNKLQNWADQIVNSCFFAGFPTQNFFLFRSDFLSARQSSPDGKTPRKIVMIKYAVGST